MRPGGRRGNRRGAQAQGRAGGRLRERAAGRGRAPGRPLRVHDPPAARRRGPGVLPRGGAANGLQGDEGGAGEGRRRRARARAVPGGGLPPPRHPRGRSARRDRPHLRLGARPPSPLADPGRPLRGDRSRERGRRDRRGPPIRRGQRQRHRGGARPEGPGQGRGADRRGARGRRRRRRSACGVSERAGTAVEHRFGPYGGRYVPETLIPALDELETAWAEARSDPGFRGELDLLLGEYVGRPTPIHDALRLSEAAGTRVVLKREDLLHTGAHKINNAIGQALLARKMGKRRVIAETGAGQHGVAAATVCALLGLECVVYMGTEDMRRQRPNVERMSLLGAEVRPVEAGARTLKEAVSEAIRDWVANVADTYYLIGSAVGPAPYPAIVRD